MALPFFISDFIDYRLQVSIIFMIDILRLSEEVLILNDSCFGLNHIKSCLV